MSSALLVFAKVPRPGDVKTRLTPVLTPAEAARLYEAFLHDALHQYENVGATVRLYLAPPLPEEEVSWLPADVSVHEQKGSGLGARMQEAFREAFQDGFDRAVVLGTDHPTLPNAFVRQSFTALNPEAPSICIGPSEDGGFYLLGMSVFYPQLFDGMTYSHDQVFTDTLTRVGSTGASLTVLPQWYDVDTPEELARLLKDLDESSLEASRTRRVVEALELEALA